MAPHALSASRAVAAIAEGRLGSVELVQSCLDRIRATDGEIGAWVHVDADGALSRAAEMDEIRRAGRPVGPLHGIPVGLKDIVDTRDMPTQRGSAIFAGRQPDSDAFLVQRLKDAGAIILGKSVTTELAFVHANETRNPHNTGHSPGGSSSGSAAAVAAFHVPLAIGTQTNGSVIRPASYCGIVGFKPTNGVISRTGLLQTSNSLDQVGVFARTLEDAALLAGVISGYDESDDLSYPRPRPAMLDGYRAEAPVNPDFAVFDLPFDDRLASDAKAGFDEVLEALEGRVERLPAPPAFRTLIDTQRIIHEYEICRHLGTVFDAHWNAVSDTLKPIVERGRKIGLAEYEDALGLKSEAEAFFAKFFWDYDAVLAPSATGEAPEFGIGTGDPVYSTIWTLAGLPCISLPLLSGNKGLPIGVQAIGAAERDDRLLRTARWLLGALEVDEDTLTQ